MRRVFSNSLRNGIGSWCWVKGEVHYVFEVVETGFGFPGRLLWGEFGLVCLLHGK